MSGKPDQACGDSGVAADGIKEPSVKVEKGDEGDGQPPPQKKSRVEDGDDGKKIDSKEVDGVLEKLSGLFRSCVRTGEDGSSVSFAFKKFCSACCAGARMLMRGVGTETHKGAWFGVLESAAVTFHEGCKMPDTLAELLKSATTGEGFAAVEGSWYGLLEAVESSALCRPKVKAASEVKEDGWDDAVVQVWKTEMKAVRDMEAADDALTLDKCLSPVVNGVNEAYAAVAAAKSVAIRDCLDEEATVALMKKAEPSKHVKAMWMRCVASCAMLCLQQTKMFWAPRCLDTLVLTLTERRASLFTKEELAIIEKWHQQAREAACSKKSGTGTHADRERESQFDRDMQRWANADVPYGKSKSLDYF